VAELVQRQWSYVLRVEDEVFRSAEQVRSAYTRVANRMRSSDKRATPKLCSLQANAPQTEETAGIETLPFPPIKVA